MQCPPIRPNLDYKTWAKQLLGFLPLDVTLLGAMEELISDTYEGKEPSQLAKDV
jgi:hypothetical protein